MVKVRRFIDAEHYLSGSYLTGNLGNDTIDVGSFAKGATIFGGGGFLFDTSTDGADSITCGWQSERKLDDSGQWW